MKLLINSSYFLRNNSWFFEFYLNVLANFLKKLFKIFNFFKRISLEISYNAIEIRFEDYIFRIAENLPYAVLILFLGFIGIFTLLKFTEAQNGVRISTISTNSMSPTITPGSLIVSAKQTKYYKGDIITFKEKNANTGSETGRVLTHKVIDVKKENTDLFFITKGDGNEIPDPGQIQEDQILGKVLIILPNIGYLTLIIKTVPGFIIFIMIPTIILIKNEVAYIKEEARLQR